MEYFSCVKTANIAEDNYVLPGLYQTNSG